MVKRRKRPVLGWDYVTGNTRTTKYHSPKGGYYYVSKNPWRKSSSLFRKSRSRASHGCCLVNVLSFLLLIFIIIFVSLVL